MSPEMSSKEEPQHGYPRLPVADYILHRVEFKLERYRRKANNYRLGYQSSAAATVIGAASVPVLINLQADPTIPTVLSLLVTILVAIEGVFHLREHWRSYDLVRSLIRQELNLFKTGAGEYHDAENSEVAYRQFVERIEQLIAAERAQTIEMRTKKAKTEGERNGGAVAPRQ